MSVEYYIIKPLTKQKFYLGRRISYLTGIPYWSPNTEPGYCSWEYYKEVIEDLWENNEYFFESDLSMNFLTNFAYAIYEFCDAPVYLDNDCSNNTEWVDYDEIDVFSDLLSSEEQWSELALLIPEEYHITDETGNILYELETVKNYILKTQKEKQSV